MPSFVAFVVGEIEPGARHFIRYTVHRCPAGLIALFLILQQVFEGDSAVCAHEAERDFALFQQVHQKLPRHTEVVCRRPHRSLVRFGRKLAIGTHGTPLHISILRGKRADSTTLRSTIQIQDAVFVFDGGMSSKINLQPPPRRRPRIRPRQARGCQAHQARTLHQPCAHLLRGLLDQRPLRPPVAPVWRNWRSHPHPTPTPNHPLLGHPPQKRRPPNPHTNRQSPRRPQRPTRQDQISTPLRRPARLGNKRGTSTRGARKKSLRLCLSASLVGKEGSQVSVQQVRMTHSDFLKTKKHKFFFEQMRNKRL